MPARIIGTCCSRAGCMKPARELGGLCTPHWMGLTPDERWSLQMQAERALDDTDEIDSLELIFRLPSHGEAA